MKLPDPAEYRSTYLAQLQPHVPEPILAVGFLSTAGYVAGIVRDHLKHKALYQVSPLASRAMSRKRRRDRAVSTEITNRLVAVTETSAYLFDFPTNGTAFQVHGPPTVWSRRGMRVTAESQGRLSQHLHVELASGERIDVDVNRSRGPWADFNDAMRDLLLQPVA